MTEIDDRQSAVASRALVDGGRYFEGPRWHRGRLWVSDTLAQTVISVGETGDCEPCAKLDDIPCGLGFLPSGDRVVLTMFGRRLLRLRDGKVEPYAVLSGVAAGTIDDMVIDGQGRACVGDLGFNLLAGAPPEAVGRLILVTPDGRSRVVADGLRFPNGIAKAAPDPGSSSSALSCQAPDFPRRGARAPGRERRCRAKAEFRGPERSHPANGFSSISGRAGGPGAFEGAAHVILHSGYLLLVRRRNAGALLAAHCACDGACSRHGRQLAALLSRRPARDLEPPGPAELPVAAPQRAGLP